MVEGPGCKLKGIKIKARLKGQKVIFVQGNAVNKEVKKKSENQESSFHQLIGRPLEDVQTLGKELFMYFGDLCLRVHFLMAGQSFINNEKVDKDSGGKAHTAVLEMKMSKDLLTFRNSSAIIRQSAPCRQKYEDLNDLDICSPVFNFTRAVAMVMEQMDRQVCDVLLDQLILPGVGNIIKNEALFDSGIRPSSKICELNKEHITFLIKMTRDFTSIFYECRRDGKPLYPYYKIYGKRRCKQCDGKVTICRQGDDSERMTYFCENCQTNDLKSKQRKLPQKNSLLGWIQTADSTTEVMLPVQDWSCSACTLINTGSSSKCSVCFTPRQSHQTAQKQTPLQSRDNTQDISFKGQSGLSPLSNQQGRKRTAQTSENSLGKIRKVENSTAVLASGRASSSGKKETVKSNQVQSSQQANMDDSSKIPFCPTHKKRVNMKEVRKEGENRGRWFFCCAVRNCKYFEWADVKFPLCPDHGKPCAIRTVLKIGPNNGRKFFACKMPKNKQCKFFEWAVGYDY